MRSGLDATTAALWSSGVYDAHFRLKVENASGTFISLEGRYDRLSLKLPDPTEPIGSVAFQCLRDSTTSGAAQSLAPLVSISDLNEDDLGAYSPLLQLGRQVTVETHLTAVGAARPSDASADWYEIFRGIIGKVSWPNHEQGRVSVLVNGLGAVLQHAKSEAPYTYAQGTSLETVVSQILTNNGFGSVPTYFPVATGSVLPNTYAPGYQKTVWSQLTAVAASLGWVCYYRYRGHGAAELTFFEPARSKVTPDLTNVYADDFNQLDIDETELRNVGLLAYVDVDGVEKLLGPYEDTASLTKYGGSLGIRRPFFIKLDEFSPVRTENAASQMLVAALSDVADPDVVAIADTRPLVFSESGEDLYTILHRDAAGRERFFDGTQNWAVYSNTIEVLANAETRSFLGVRGTPSAGGKTWRTLATQPPTPRSLAPHYPPMSSQEGYWPCDNFLGTKIYDVSGNDRDAEVGTATVTRVPGIAGMALSFAGNGSGYTLLPHADAAAIEDLFYVAGWIKVSTVSGNTAARLFERDDSDYFALRLNQGTAFPQTITIDHEDGVGGVTTEVLTGIVPQNKWLFYLLQFDDAGGVVEFWYAVEGDPEVKLGYRIDTWLGWSEVSSRPIVFGSKTEATISAANPFNGIADELMIGSTFLNKNQIQALFKLPGLSSQRKITGSEVGDTLDLTAKSITADTGSIGGWGLTNGTLVSGSAVLDAVNEQLRLGAATAPLTGIGIFIGKDGADYEFRAGNPVSGKYIHWDGTDLDVSGSIFADYLEATVGSLGGWTLGPTSLAAGNVILESTNERIRLGAATGPLTGIGVFIGKDGGSNYDFRVGDPAGHYLHWDGSLGLLTLAGQIVYATNFGGSALVGWEALVRRALNGARNLLFNSGFEDGDNFWNTGTNAVVTTNATEARTGNKYLLLTTPVNGTISCEQRDDVGAVRYYPIMEGDVIKVSGYVYRLGTGNQRPGIIVELLDKDKANPSYLGATTTAGTDTSYTYIESSFTVPSGKAFGRVYCELYDAAPSGTSSCRFDDIQLKILVEAGDIVADTITATQIGSLAFAGKTATFDTGFIGGWVLATNSLSNNGIELRSGTGTNEPSIRVGAATAPLTGDGIFIGKDGSDWEFRVGNVAGDYIHFDGTTFTIKTNTFTGSNPVFTGRVDIYSGQGNLRIKLHEDAGGPTISLYEAGPTEKMRIKGEDISNSNGILNLVPSRTNPTPSLRLQTVDSDEGYAYFQNLQTYHPDPADTADAIHWDKGNIQARANTGSRTITLNDGRNNASYLLIITAGSGAVASWTWPTVKWWNNTAPVLSTVSGRVDIIQFFYANGAWHGMPVSGWY